MEKGIKGIFELDSEIEDFFQRVGSSKIQKLGVKMCAEWELDRVTLLLEDKDGNSIGVLVFQCDEFRNLLSPIVNPKIESVGVVSDVEKAQIEKECEADYDFMVKNPTAKEIGKYHGCD